MTTHASDCATHNGPAVEMRPCPFCGREPAIEEHPAHTHVLATFMPYHPGSWTIECACGCGLIRDTREAVVAAWNARASDPAP
jgi:Restriction alleviation protein Lar